jgi:luciferase family oxidoreductase group 1
LLAPKIEALGYSRYWLAEHHGLDGFCGPNPVVMTALVAGLTEKMHVGPAGILLNYTSPLKVAQDFRMLQTLFPGRIDLGIARAPVVDSEVEAALLDGRPPPGGREAFEQRVRDVQALLTGRVGDNARYRNIYVVPELLKGVPIAATWVLGTSVHSAVIAAELGTAYAFSLFYARDPEEGVRSFEIYREQFRPSPEHKKPKTAVCMVGVCAKTERRARELAGATETSPERKTMIGTPTQWRDEIKQTRRHYQADEIVICGIALQDHKSQLESYRLIAEACGLTRR